VVGGGCAVTVRSRGDDEHQRRWVLRMSAKERRDINERTGSGTCLSYLVIIRVPSLALSPTSRLTPAVNKEYL
jgi:hypothetical protein